MRRNGEFPIIKKRSLRISDFEEGNYIVQYFPCKKDKAKLLQIQTLRSRVVDYVILLPTLYDIIFQ
jgi:hypothetical protein